MMKAWLGTLVRRLFIEEEVEEREWGFRDDAKEEGAIRRWRLYRSKEDDRIVVLLKERFRAQDWKSLGLGLNGASIMRAGLGFMKRRVGSNASASVLRIVTRSDSKHGRE